MKLRVDVLALIALIIITKCCPHVLGIADTDGPIEVNWWKVNELFTNIVNNALYRRELQDVIDNEFQWSTREIDPNKVLEQQLAKVEAIFLSKVEGLKRFHKGILESFHELRTEKPTSHCCKVKKDDPAEDIGCFHGKGLTTSLIANIPNKLLEQVKNIVYLYDNLDILYMSLADGSTYVYPEEASRRMLLYNAVQHCQNYQGHIRPWYILAESPQPRDVVLMIDMDGTESSETNKLTAAVFKSVLRSLSTEDMIVIATKKSLILNSDRWRHVESNVWLIATTRNINSLILLLDKVILSGNREAKESYDFLLRENRVQTCKKLFESPIKLKMNISRPAPLKVLVQISNKKELTSCIDSEVWKDNNVIEPIIITYYTGSESVDSCKNQINSSHVVHIHDIGSLDIKENKLSNFFKWSDYLDKSNITEIPVRMTMPYSSYYDRGIIVSLTIPLIIKGVLVGVAATDFHVTHDQNDVQSLLGIKDAYSFLIDNQGRTLFHPFLPAGLCKFNNQVKVCQDPTLEFIDHLEQEDEVLDVIQSMVDMQRGNKTVMGNIILGTGHVTKMMNNLVTLQPTKLLYLWAPLLAAKMSIAVVLPLHRNKVFNVTYSCTNKMKCKQPEFHYHLDLDPKQSEQCGYFGAEVLKNEGLVKFPPSMFKTPATYLRMIKSEDDPVMKALKAGKPFDSVLKGSNFKKNIDMINSVESVWKEGTDLSCFVGIRYFCTPDGVFMSYPGMTLTADYDSRKRSWYQSGVAAIGEQNIMSLTLPYRDFFSGGEVITLVTPLLKTFESGLSVLGAVAAADFSVVFLRHRLQKALPECSSSEMECFLMDTMGYIPLHLTNLNASKMHITKFHPIIARNLIAGNFLRRNGCHDFEQDLIFLYWTFELSCDTTTYSSSEDATVFSLYKIPFMNLYLVASRNKTTKISSNEMKIEPLRNNECLTTCFKGVEPPCKVLSDIECPLKEQDMRLAFPSLPACLPSYASHKDKSKKPCEYKQDNSCYSLKKKECEYWDTVCM